MRPTTIKTFQHQFSKAFGFSVSISGQQSLTGPKKEYSVRVLTSSCGWAEGGGRCSQNTRILLVHRDCGESHTISLFRPHFSFKCEVQIHGKNKWNTGGRDGEGSNCWCFKTAMSGCLLQQFWKTRKKNVIFPSVAKKTNDQREQLK